MLRATQKIVKKIVELSILMVLFSSAAWAQAPAGAPPHQPAFGELMMRMLPMFVMVFFVFYFLVIRPQHTKLKQQADMLSKLAKGDQVVTAGGILGKFAGFENGFVILDVGGSTRIRVERDKVVQKYDKKEPAEKKEVAA